MPLDRQRRRLRARSTREFEAAVTNMGDFFNALARFLVTLTERILLVAAHWLELLHYSVDPAAGQQDDQLLRPGDAGEWVRCSVPPEQISKVVDSWRIQAKR